MGVTWLSEATIFTTEPETIKRLIEETKADELFTSVNGLEIIYNTITFNSSGYGYYGIVAPWDNPDETNLLFKYLFDNYDGALVCHEVVSSCQSDEFCFSTSWTKEEGKIDWENGEGETYSILSSTIAESYSDLLIDDFDAILVWSTHINDPLITPSLKKLIQIAKKQGFTDWASEEELEEFYDNDESITYKTIGNIEEYLNDCDDDLIMDALLEADRMMIALSSNVDSHIDFPSELAEPVNIHNRKWSKR